MNTTNIKYEIVALRTLLEDGTFSGESALRRLNKYRTLAEGMSPDVQEEFRKTEEVANKLLSSLSLPSISKARRGGGSLQASEARPVIEESSSLKDRAKADVQAPVLLAGMSKTDLAARAVIAGGLVYAFGPYAGLVGAGLSYGVEKSMGWLASQAFGLLFRHPQKIASTTPAPIGSFKAPDAAPKDAAPPSVVESAKEARFDLHEDPPIGIFNEGNTCFIASAVQLILKDPVLTEALIEEWNEGGDAREFGEFIINYKEAQRNKSPLSGIAKLRDAMVRCSGQKQFIRGQWDANEVLRSILSNEQSALYKRLKKKGYFLQESVRRYYEVPEGCIPVISSGLHLDEDLKLYYSEQLAERPGSVEVMLRSGDKNKTLQSLLESYFESVDLTGSQASSYTMQDFQRHECFPIFEKTSWKSIPDLVRVNLKRWDSQGRKVSVPLTVTDEMHLSVAGETLKLQVIGFTRHISSFIGGGHLISYTMENGNYYCSNDGSIKAITKEEFLKQAGMGSDLLLKVVERSSLSDDESQ